MVRTMEHVRRRGKSSRVWETTEKMEPSFPKRCTEEDNRQLSQVVAREILTVCKDKGLKKRYEGIGTGFVMVVSIFRVF